jgi:AhpD family alkylhydroperoxidase
MALDQRDKELVAVGASIGALCRSCIDHHIGAAREAGLTEAKIARAVGAAQATERLAQQILFRHTDDLLKTSTTSVEPIGAQQLGRDDELVALGASIGSNCHPLLAQHITGTLGQGLTASQVRSAIKMAEVVQQHAAEITAEKAATVFESVDRTLLPAP